MKSIVRIGGLIISLLFFLSPISGQVSKDTFEASQYLKKAEAFESQKKYDSAIVLYKEYLKMYPSSNDTIFGKTQKTIANLYYEQGNYEKAQQHYNSCLLIYERVYTNNHPEIAKIHRSQGITYRFLINFTKAEEHFKIALAIFKKNNMKFEESKVFNNIGNVYRAQGIHQKAIEHYRQALNILIENKIDNQIYEAGYLNNIALAYNNKEDWDNSLKYHFKVLALKEKSYSSNSIQLANSYNNIGLVYYEKNEIDKAMSYYSKALNNYLSKNKKDNFIAVDTYVNIANALRKKRDFNLAITYAEKGISETEKKYGKLHYFSTFIYHTLALIYFELEEHKKAITYCDIALKSNSIKPEKTTNLNTAYDPLYYLKITNSKLEILNSYLLKDMNTNHLNEALKIGKSLDHAVSALEQKISGQDDKLLFSSTANKIYKNIFNTNYFIYKNQNITKAFNDLWYYSEKSKAANLRSFIRDQDIKSFRKLPNQLLAMEKKLKLAYSFYSSALTNELTSNPEGEMIRKHQDSLFAIKNRLDSINKVLKVNFAEYYKLKHETDVLTPSEIKQKLNNNTTMLSFFRSGVKTYIFILNKENSLVVELSTSNLKQHVASFRNYLLKKETEAYKKSAFHLYKQLMQPVSNYIEGEELIIIPEEELWHLDFGLLVTKLSKSNNPKKIPYLLKDHAIVYANSAAIWSNSTNKKSSNHLKEKCLAFSYSSSNSLSKDLTRIPKKTKNSMTDLPGTRKEILEISSLIDGDFFYGDNSTEKKFKKKAHQYRILHLALHGETYNDDKNSKLYFTKSLDSNEDGILYDHELFAMDIPAELATLSACNTGSGKIAKGEGIISLGNAFQYAGVKTLLLTQWKISDQSTPKLMKDFYNNLKSGMTKSKALQKTQLDYLKTADATRSHPIYWSGFYLLGNSNPILLKEDYSKIIFLILSILIILVSIIIHTKFYGRKSLCKKSLKKLNSCPNILFH